MVSGETGQGILEPETRRFHFELSRRRPDQARIRVSALNSTGSSPPPAEAFLKAGNPGVEAFSTPLEPEDIFELSRGLDEILNSAKNIVGEAEAMQTAPDGAMAEMAAELADSTRRLAEIFAMMTRNDRAVATAVAELAVKDQRHLEHTYRVAMSALVDDQNLREVTARRELYRRLTRTGDDLVGVAERSGTRC